MEKKHGPWTARPIDGTARVEILDERGGLIAVTDDNHATDIIEEHNAIGAIHAILDAEGEEWDSETMSAVAEVITDLGFEIRDPNEFEEGT